jgi:hypothetical protein
VADLYTQVEDRINAILQDGRGADGALGPEVTSRAIPAGTFRRVADNAPLTDPSFPAEAFDCGYVLRFDDASDDPAPNNPYQSVQFQRCTLSVSVGYMQSPTMTGFVEARGSETPSVEVARADRRALSDAMRIKRALEFGPLRGADTDPVMVECTRLDATNVDLGGGRLVCTSRFRLVIQYDGTASYGP